MGFVQTIILAIVQGATEFLPVSSKTHLAVIGKVLGIHELPLDFVVTMHVGTLVAVVAYFWKDLCGILSSPFRAKAEGGEEADATSRVPREGNPHPDPLPGGEGVTESARDQWRLLGLLALGTVPAGILGKLLEDELEPALNNLTLDGVGWLVTALFLYGASRLRGTMGLRQTGWRQALAIGFAQACALLPGVSRSGATIAGGLAVGLSRDWAPRFAFLLSVPIILAGALLKTKELLQGRASEMFDPATYGVAIVVSAIVGYLAIRLVMNSVRRGNLVYYAAYCLVLGVGAIVAGRFGG
jgi:undecaprenyl-diphosphatase